VAQTHAHWPGATVREVYLLLLQHCANHVRSAFADSIHNYVTLLGGVFTPSTRDSVSAALAPFDVLLAYVIGRLAFDQSRALPSESAVEIATGFRGQHQVTLVGELVECGLLHLDDIPGALPRYRLTDDFGWVDRYRLFWRAHNAWQVRKEAAAANPRREPDDPDDEDANKQAAGRSSGFDTAALSAALSDASERSANKIVRRFDKFQSQLLERLLAGQRFEGDYPGRSA
jgi:hypothetical protein